MPPAGEITGCTPVGSVGVLQAIERLLAHEVVVAAVFELQADEAERVDGVGADDISAPACWTTAISIGIVT